MCQKEFLPQILPVQYQSYGHEHKLLEQIRFKFWTQLYVSVHAPL